jgi:hypothetical protein
LGFPWVFRRVVFFKSNILGNTSETPVYIIDARSKSAAVANMAVGGGYEDYGGEFGNDLKILWMNIANIHVVRESLDKLRCALLFLKNIFPSNLICL